MQAKQQVFHNHLSRDKYTWKWSESDGRETRSDWQMGGLENKCPLINPHYTVLQLTTGNEAYFKIHSPHLVGI